MVGWEPGNPNLLEGTLGDWFEVREDQLSNHTKLLVEMAESGIWDAENSVLRS